MRALTTANPSGGRHLHSGEMARSRGGSISPRWGAAGLRPYMTLLGHGTVIAGWKREDVGGAFFVAKGFVHSGDGRIADQTDGDFGAVEAELFAHTSKKCFEWRPGDADGSLAVQNHTSEY